MVKNMKVTSIKRIIKFDHKESCKTRKLTPGKGNIKKERMGIKRITMMSKTKKTKNPIKAG